MPTNTGAAKLAYAMSTNQQVRISHMAIGDGGGAAVAPSAARSALVREVHRAQLNQLYQHPENANWLVAEIVLPPEVGGFTIRELMLYDADGDPIFNGNHPEQYKPIQSEGSEETKTIRMIILVSSVATVTLKTDPTTVLATIAYVDGKLATESEAKQGAVNNKYSSPLRVAQYVAEKTQNSATDSGANKLMTVGAFGLGSAAVPSITDFNTVGRTGFYLSGTTAANSPEAGQPFQLIHVERNATYASQIAFDANSDDFYMRNRTGVGAWGAWRKLYHHGSVSAVIRSLLASGDAAAARAAIELGSAAQATMTQNHTDATAGRALQVGDFGLGSSGVPSLGADFNAVTVTGFYLSAAPALNAPVANEHFQVVHIERNASYSSQIAISSQRLGVIYFRNRVGAEWGTWLELFHKGNLSPVEAARKVEAGNGLSGGGALSADRTISLGTPGKLGRSSTNGVTVASHTHELDVQQGDYDSTVGRLALVGGFGLGGNLGSTTAREDFNDATLTTGWYRMSSAALNAPASGFHVLNVIAYTSDFCMQLAYPMTPGAGAYIRERASGAWGSWGKLIHSGNAALLPLLTALAPETDNNRTLGTAAKRWSTVYAGTGTINTSDGREKTAVRTLTAAELSAAKQLAREVGAYRFLSAVAEKGAAAREHAGMTVQRAIEVMESHGLDPFGYGFICYDEWPEEWRDVPAVMDTRQTGEVTAEGDPVFEEFELEPARRELLQPAGDRFSFRPDELLMFIAAGFEARLASLEAAG